MHWSSGIGSSVTKADSCWSPQLPKGASCVCFTIVFLIGILNSHIICLYSQISVLHRIKRDRFVHNPASSLRLNFAFCLGSPQTNLPCQAKPPLRLVILIMVTSVLSCIFPHAALTAIYLKCFVIIATWMALRSKQAALTRAFAPTHVY